MYKKLRYRSQFGSDFHEIHTVGAGSFMGKPYGFWKQSAQWKHRYRGKCAPKTSFSGLSQTGWGFLRKKLKNCIWHLIYQKKKGYIHFCHSTPVPSKMVTSPKNNFSLIFWKILFFSKKLLDKKYSKCRCL